MKMIGLKHIHLIFITAIAVIVSACVPKATEKKAICGVNESFNSVTRNCYSILAARFIPVATKTSDTLSQEVAKTITLTYTDGNNDKAISCKLTSVSANIEAVSPEIINGGIFTQSDNLITALTSLIAVIPNGATAASANTTLTNMQTALGIARASFNNTTVTTQITSFVGGANTIFGLAAPYNTSTYPALQSFYSQAQTKIVAYTTLSNMVANHCDCVGGVCTTTIAPKIFQSGAAGFTYTITDIDGESSPQVVNLSIAAMATNTNFLLPVVDSNYVTFSESATSTPTSSAFTLPSAHDYFGTVNYSYAFTGGTLSGGYYFTPSGLGKISGCLGLTGTSGPTDTSCIYTPISGDTNYPIASPAPATAVTTINDLTFTAKKPGSYANNFTIQYFDLNANNLAVDSYVTKSETFGLISATNTESFVRVVGNAVKVFINPGVTSTIDIRNLLNSDLKAKNLFTVTGGALSTLPDPSVATPTPISMGTTTAGTDSWDKIIYTVNNGSGTSTNSASIIVNMTPTEDPPVWNYVASTSVTALEDSGAMSIVLTPTYTDAESNVDACDVDQTASLFTTYFTFNSCTCVVNACTLSITPKPNVSSSTAYPVYYRVGSAGLYTSYRAYSVTLTPVNDVPVLSTVLAAQTILENSTAAPSSGSYALTATTGDSIYEPNQVLTLTASSANTTLLPNNKCQNYTPGAVTPILNVAPTAAGQYYYDTANKICYVSTGTTNTSWARYSSLSVMPTCAYDVYGQGAPSVAPTASGKHYLDTTNNKCYISSGTTVGSWALDTVLTFNLAYTPVQNKSGSSVITVGLSDNGGTTNGGVDTAANQTFTLNVTSVDDPPYFIQTITSVQTNEGGAVVAGPFYVNEDQGDSSDEDVQAMNISAITSDNAAVLPITNISIFYDLNNNGVADAGESRVVGATLENAATDDVKLHAFYLKLSPIAGVAGNSNIKVTINDGNVAASHSVSTTFSLIVNPVAALHGGWSNIAAVGFKTDKNGAPANSSDIVCNYNKATDLHKCDTTSTGCTGAFPPNSTVTPSGVNVLYWDSSAKKCYRSQGTDKFSWLEMDTTCPITRLTGGENYLYDSTLLPAQTVPTPTYTSQYYYKTSNNTCYYSTRTGPGTYAWSATPYIPSKVTFSWNAFTLSGSGADSAVQIEGWNVYRREKGYDYDFNNGFLKINTADTMTISTASTRTFTDITAIAGKVYYYLVRPIDSRHHLPTYSPEVFSEVRVLAPASNYAFVHRWMVNQEVCNSMHMTTTTTNKVDPVNNYRCPYFGPGESTANPGYYDIEKDLVVDISEVGCPYTAAPACTTNGCVGIGTPTSQGLSASLYNIYYDRNSGSCYINTDGATTWASYNAATAGQIAAASANVNSALNVPLVNISQAQSTAVCANRSTASVVSAGLGIANGASANAPTVHSLPTKKEFIAYSAPPIGVGDATLGDMEQGFSLNVQSRCNSSSANGLEIAYTDSTIPSTSYIYSLPGTSSSGIKSLYTGSVPWVLNAGTESCSSRYGVQDVYGNVAEWVSDRMTCAVQRLQLQVDRL